MNHSKQMTNNIIGITYKNSSKKNKLKITDENREYVRKTNFNEDFWDSDSFPGYQGFKYDSRWEEVALFIIDYFNLTNDSKILDLGCGKGYLLYEIHKLLPQAEVHGVDISKYAIDNAKKEIKEYIKCASSTNLPYDNNYFDFIYSLNVIYFMPEEECTRTINEINRIKTQKSKTLIQVASYRDEEEKRNMINWDLGILHKSIEEWKRYFKEVNYLGDYSFVIHGDKSNE